MVKHVNVAIDENLYERAQAVKREQDLTWGEFMEWAVAELETTERN